MKKLFFINHQNSLWNKRFVFDVSDQEKSGMRAAIEASTQEQKEQLFDETKKLDKDKISAEYTKKVDTYINGKKAEIKGKETDADKQKKLEEDYAAALAALRAESLTKLSTMITDAEAKRDANAKSWATGMSETLVKFNREAMKDGLDKNMEKDQDLYKHVDEIDTGSNSTGLRTTNEIKSFLEAIYIEEGRAGAMEMAQKMEEKSKNPGVFSVRNIDEKTFNELFGDNVKQTVKDIGMYNSSLNPINVDMGRMWGLVYEAQKQFGTDDKGKEAYSAYINAMKTQYESLKKTNPRFTSQDAMNMAKAFPTPTEWTAQNPEYRFNLKKFADTGAKDADINQLLEKVQDKGVRQNLNGIIDGIRASEPDPKKQQDLIDKLFKDMGKNLEDVGSLKDTDLKLFAEKNGRNGYGSGAWEINNDEKKADNIADRVRGYLSGLAYGAETLDYGQYDNDLSVGGKTHDVAIAYKSYLADQMKSGSKLMQEVMKDNNGLTDSKDKRKRADIENAMLEKVKTGLLSPKDFAAQIYDKEWNKENMKDGKLTERGFVTAWLTELPRGKNPFNYDRLEGALIGAIQGKDRTQWHSLIEQQVQRILGGAATGDEYLTEDAFKSMDENLFKGREVYNAGHTVDAKSKGYISGMIMRAEHLEGSSPEFMEKYRAYVQEQMKKLDQDEDFKGLVKMRPVVTAMAGNDDAAKLRGMDALESQMYEKTKSLLKTPDDFQKEFKESKDKAVSESNKNFLDTYADKAGDPVKTLDKIFAGIPKDKLDDAKKKSLQEEMSKAKDNDERLQILAKAKGYADHIQDPSVDEAQYYNAAFNYGMSKKILTLNTLDIAKKEKSYQGFLNQIAKQFNLSEDGKEVTDALAKIKAVTDPAQRAAVIAEQLAVLANAAVAPSGGGNVPTWPFNKEDFETYSKYIAEKKEQAAKAQKKAAASGGGMSGGGSAPTPGPRVRSRRVPRGGSLPPGVPQTGGDKAKVGPTEKKEVKPEIDAATYKSVMVSSMNSALDSMKDQTFVNLISTASKLENSLDSAVTSALRGYDLSNLAGKTVDANTQGIGASSGPSKTIDEGSFAIFNSFSGTKEWVEKNMKANSEQPEKKEDVEKQLAGYQGTWATELNKLGGGTGYPYLKTGDEVAKAIINRWTTGTQIPADLMAKITQYPDLNAKYKPGNVFASTRVLFSGVDKKVTISLSYDSNGVLTWNKGPEELTS